MQGETPNRRLLAQLRRYAACVLLVFELPAAEPDQAVLTVMRSLAPDIQHVQVIKRVAVDAELELVVALGVEKDGTASRLHSAWWGAHRTLGILLQRRNHPALIYKIAISKGTGDCEVRVERATAKDTVLSCTPEKGRFGPNHEFVYDVRSKSLVKQIEYEPFSFERIFGLRKGAVLMGSDTKRLIAIKYTPAAEPPFRVLEGAQARQWTQRVETSTGSIGSGPGFKQVISLKEKQFRPIQFGPGNQFTLTREDKRFMVLDQAGRRYPLPQSSYDEFARLRPSRVSNGYVKEGTIIDEAIGAWQIADGVLWFAKEFYDGEGNTGVGGFGSFDTGQLKYRIISPPELVNWSATAVAVRPEAVWLALARNGEYRSTGGGLLRVDRATAKVDRIEFPESVSEMVYIGNQLLLATEFGAALLEDYTLRRFFVDQTTDGRLQVTESRMGN